MIAANDNSGPPPIRKGQRWLFKGQNWKIHEVVSDGVVVLIGPHNRHELLGTYADELYLCGELLEEAKVDKATERLAQAFEKAQAALANPKRKRGPKPRLPAVPRPWKCSVLAIDTAKNSGWSLWVEGNLRDFGEVKKDKDHELLAICTLAHEYPPAILVVEEPQTLYRGHGLATFVGLGAAHEAWRRAWRDAGGVKSRTVRVKPTRWRSALLGRVKNVADLERQRAQLILREHGARVPDDLGADESAALCIGAWAILSGEVGARLPATLRIAI